MEENRNDVTVIEMNSDGTNTVSAVPAEEFDSYEVATDDSKIGVGSIVAGAAAIVGIAATAKWCWMKGKKIVETYKAGKAVLAAEQDDADETIDEVEVFEDPVTEFVNKRKEEKEGK